MKVLSYVLSVLAVLALVNMAVAKEGAGSGAKLSKFSGAITKIDAGAITVESKGDAAAESKTFTTDTNTKVFLPADVTTTAPTAKGDGKKGPALKAGTVADLKVGDHVTVMYDDKNVAHAISVHAVMHKKGSEGK